MCAFGAAEALATTAAARAAHFAAASACFAAVLRSQSSLHAAAAAAPGVGRPRAAALRRLLAASLAVWCAFPALRLATLGGAAGPVATEVLLTALDVVAKSLFTLHLRQAAFAHHAGGAARRACERALPAYKRSE